MNEIFQLGCQKDGGTATRNDKEEAVPSSPPLLYGGGILGEAMGP